MRRAFNLAREAHATQRRKEGEPYIFHPVAVAKIVAADMGLDADAVSAAFLRRGGRHPHTLEEIRSLFGSDVERPVDAVTKRRKETYEYSGRSTTTATCSKP